MASDEHFPGFVPGRGYTQEDWDEVCDNPEITPEQWAKARPLVDAMPELVEAMERRRGPQKAPTKDLVSLRLDKDVLATLRAGGSGWQSRANEMLRKGLGLDVEEGSFEQSDHARWLASMTDILRRIFAGEKVPSDDVERITLALQERAKTVRSETQAN